jgi:hypothetical protein
MRRGLLTINVICQALRLSTSSVRGNRHASNRLIHVCIDITPDSYNNRARETAIIRQRPCKQATISDPSLGNESAFVECKQQFRGREKSTCTVATELYVYIWNQVIKIPTNSAKHFICVTITNHGSGTILWGYTVSDVCNVVDICTNGCYTHK